MVILSYNRTTNLIEAYHAIDDAEPFWTGESVEAGTVTFRTVPGRGAMGFCGGWISFCPSHLVARTDQDEAERDGG